MTREQHISDDIRLDLFETEHADHDVRLTVVDEAGDAWMVFHCHDCAKSAKARLAALR